MVDEVAAPGLGGEGVVGRGRDLVRPVGSDEAEGDRSDRGHRCQPLVAAKAAMCSTSASTDSVGRAL